MDDVGRCAWGEILQTAPAGSSLVSFLDDMLVSGADLIWKEAGPGRGKEMRRAFSGLFGRFFARAYLESYHGFVWFAQIDGDNFEYSPFRVRRKPGSKTEMPDWLCGGPGGLVGIAEAKGSHLGGKATPRKAPKPICTAEGQISGVAVEELVGPTGSQRWQLRKVKGWAVMSRWGVASPARAPYLYALDPETDGESLSPGSAEALAQTIARTHIKQLARGLGVSLIDESGTSSAQDAPDARGLRTWAVRLHEDEKSPDFFGRFMSPFGPVDLDPQQAKSLSLMLPDPNLLRFVGLSGDVLDSYRSNSRIEARPRYLIRDTAVVGPDGLVVAPVEQILEIDQIGPVAS
jgi:hypothetical protein